MVKLFYKMQPNRNKDFKKNFAINKSLGYVLSKNIDNRFNVDTTPRKVLNKNKKDSLDNQLKRNTATNKDFSTTIIKDQNKFDFDINQEIQKTYNKIEESDQNFDINQEIQKTYNKIEESDQNFD
ncbi:MAG: hypothetical protein EBQ85_00025, partial [Proteobacteria bacterium]|nr:hypothetical protein [Pseudomonadota bacterium]